MVGQCATHLLLPALIARPLHPRLPPLIRNVSLVPILLTRARALSFPAAFAFDAGRAGACAYGSSMADATSSAVGTRQSSDRVHETEEARGGLFYYFSLRSRWLGNSFDLFRVYFGGQLLHLRIPLYALVPACRSSSGTAEVVKSLV